MGSPNGGRFFRAVCELSDRPTLYTPTRAQALIILCWSRHYRRHQPWTQACHAERSPALRKAQGRRSRSIPRSEYRPYPDEELPPLRWQCSVMPENSVISTETPAHSDGQWRNPLSLW